MSASFLRKQCVFTHKLWRCYGPPSDVLTYAIHRRPNLAGITDRLSNKPICRFFCAVILGSENCTNEKSQGQLESVEDDCDTFGKLKKPLENPRSIKPNPNISKMKSTADHVTTRTFSKERIEKPNFRDGEFKDNKKLRSRSDYEQETYQEDTIGLISRPTFNESGKDRPLFMSRDDRKKGDVVKGFKNKKLRSRSDYKQETYHEDPIGVISRPARNESGKDRRLFVSRDDRKKGDVVKGFKIMSPHEEKFPSDIDTIWNLVENYANHKELLTSEVQEEVDADTFGNLVENDSKHKELLTSEIQEEEDSDDKPPSEFKRKRYEDYANDMRDMVRSGRLKEALDYLDQLNSEVRLKHASSFLFCLMIGYCGKVGYTERAFKLFKQMKERGLKVTPGVLTGLFNSCAECPFPEYGLKKAKNLYESMKLKGWQPSAISYHAMIKAFGKLGDLKTAFEIVDEMKEKRHSITDETFSFLLMACISDKEAGFTHAVSVLRKMRNMKIRPSVYNYDLFLRAVRDCGIGPPEVAAQLLLGWKGTNKEFLSKGMHLQTEECLKSGINASQQNFALIEKGEIVNDVRNIDGAHSEDVNALSKLDDAEEQNLVEVLSVVKVNPDVENPPVDLLLPKPTSGQSLVGLSEVKWPDDRLALVGGLRGMMMKYKRAKLKPSIKTFTILLKIISPNRKAEDELLLEMDENHVKPDTDFFNVMIKKRRVRNDVAGARNTLSLINKYGLHPDIATFGVLAMTCQTREEVRSFLNDVLACGFRPNVEIYGTLVHGACRNVDMKILLDVMNSMKDNEVKPDAKMLKELEDIKTEAKKMVIAVENGQCVPEQFQSQYFQDSYKKFSLYYNQWLKTVGFELPKHPWQQYKENIQ